MSKERYQTPAQQREARGGLDAADDRYQLRRRDIEIRGKLPLGAHEIELAFDR